MTREFARMLFGSVVAMALMLSANARANSLWGICPAEPERPDMPVSQEIAGKSGWTDISADKGKFVEEGVSTFSGNVELVHERSAARADRATYDPEKGLLEAEGNVRFWDPSIFWQGEYSSVDRANNTATLERGSYNLLGRRGRGGAKMVEVEPDNDITRLKEVSYTTCPSNSKAAWTLAAKDIELDHDSERGRALHVFLKVKDVPIFYLPYLSFPISDKRKSGMLPPTLGTTNNSGFDIRVPIYWNIAPAHDATFTPRILSDRGAMLGAQYRYLVRGGGSEGLVGSGFGEFNMEYLPSDSKFEDQDRAFLGARIEQRFASNKAHLNIDYNTVSDAEYFEDFGNSLSLSSSRVLTQKGDLSYRGSFWSLLGRVHHLQNVDPSRRAGTPDPYTRLPQIFFRTHFLEKPNALNYGFSAETTYFTRNDTPGENDNVVGARVNINPEVRFPIYTQGGFLIPKLQLHHTEYFLDPQGGGTSLDSRQGRTLPMFSVDSGLFLERDLTLGAINFLHTIEPRLFYLYVPNSEQEEIPVFDTGEYDIAFAQLFRENRFNNLDRIGDANQISMALTSRLVDKRSGLEWLRARVGQAYYFRDRRVNLPNRDVEDNTVSELIAEIDARITQDWSARFDLQWDPVDNQNDKSTARLRYSNAAGMLFNAGYRFRRDRFGRAGQNIEQIDVSGRWPITPSWGVIGRWNYALPGSRTSIDDRSLENGQTLEVLGGIEYNTCCWGVRSVIRHYLRSANREGNNLKPRMDTGFFVQLEFKGLAGYGRDTVKFLKNSIPGYENQF